MNTSKCVWISCVFTLAACQGSQTTSSPGTPGGPPASAPSTSQGAAPAVVPAQVVGVVPDFATLAARVVPAVVSIQVEQHIKMGGRAGPTDPFDFFRFFGQDVPREFENRGLGSGFVIESQGIILTNAHVVEKADSIEVMFAMEDGSEKRMNAKILGQASDYDVAVIKTEEDAHAATIELGDSDAIRIADWVMAIGNPFGLDHSVSVGIISAKDRRNIEPSGRKGLYDFLQTDASINPGNSGGPLVNLRGQVIGINSAVNAQGQGIGFAIPINMVKAMLPQLRAGGKFVRSWLGLHIQPLTPELAQSFGLPTPHGVVVAEVVGGGPADRAGVHEGDVILTFDSKKIGRASDLQLFASMAGVGKTVPLVIWRDRHETTIQVKLEAFVEHEDDSDAGHHEGSDENKAGLGLWLTDISASIRQRLQLGGSGGAWVENVDPGTPAARAGLMRGDVILDVNDEPVASARALIKKIKSSPDGSVLRMRVWRAGARSFVALRKP